MRRTALMTLGYIAVFAGLGFMLIGAFHLSLLLAGFYGAVMLIDRKSRKSPVDGSV